jgi:hypothetical protein
MLPKAPESQLRKDSNPLVEALFNYQLIHIEAYVVHVDLVLSQEIAYKLTPETISALIEYHQDIYLVDIGAQTWHWSEKEAQVKRLHEEFVQAINKFVYRTTATALEGIEDDGAGELLCGRSEDVKSAIMGLFLPLLPPPPRIVDVVRPQPLLPSSPSPNNWWQSSMSMAPAPVEAWKIVPSSPSPTTSASSQQSLWASLGMELTASHHSSPSPTYTQAMQYTSAAYTSAAPVSAPLAQLPLPSMIAQQCSIGTGYGSFGWDRYQPEYPTSM